jgi:hypothetical protein
MAGAVCITTKAQAWETATDSHSHSPHADAQRPSALGKPFPCSDLGPLTTIDLRLRKHPRSLRHVSLGSAHRLHTTRGLQTHPARRRPRVSLNLGGMMQSAAPAPGAVPVRSWIAHCRSEASDGARAIRHPLAGCGSSNSKTRLSALGQPQRKASFPFWGAQIPNLCPSCLPLRNLPL